jgi:hypothetical protein
MARHSLVVSPTPARPGRFDVRLADSSQFFVESSRVPFCDAARALLAGGLAAPGDLLAMRHAGSTHDALKAAVGVAARLTVDETSTPRFAGWKPMPPRTSEGAASMRPKIEGVLGQLSDQNAPAGAARGV